MDDGLFDLSSLAIPSEKLPMHFLISRANFQIEFDRVSKLGGWGTQEDDEDRRLRTEWKKYAEPCLALTEAFRQSEDMQINAINRLNTEINQNPFMMLDDYKIRKKRYELFYKRYALAFMKLILYEVIYAAGKNRRHGCRELLMFCNLPEKNVLQFILELQNLRQKHIATREEWVIIDSNLDTVREKVAVYAKSIVALENPPSFRYPHI